MSSASPVRITFTENAPLPDVVVPLSAEAVERAGIVVAAAPGHPPLYRRRPLNRLDHRGSVREGLLPGRVGNDATVTTAAYPRLSLRSRVSYIGPQVNPETRTAKVRVEVPNPRGEVRLGMYADVVVAGAPSASVPVIPRSAVQNVGDRTVVYLANPKEPGKFTEREVRLGDASGEQVEVTSGVQPGDGVVTEGSFYVRAERERLGLRPPAATPAGASAPERPAGSVGDTANIQSAKIVVNEQGFEPAKVALSAGVPARLTFIVRQTTWRSYTIRVISIRACSQVVDSTRIHGRVIDGARLEIDSAGAC